jgi:hypothetical protein
VLTSFARVLACVAAAGFAASAQAQTKPSALKVETAPKSVLFVGNSFYYYNNGMQAPFVTIARAADNAHRAEYRATMATIGGSGLNWHDMEGYFNKGMASYSFDDKNEVHLNSFDKPFDVVIMNDCSQCPIHPQLSGLFREYVKKHGDTVRQHGATPVLFMPWAYADKPEMTAQLAEAYTSAGNDNRMLVIPAGLAFANALAKNSDLILYADDKRHPSPAGTYLGAATAYAAVYGKSPVGAPAPKSIDPSVAGLLQSVAWETVQQYYGRGDPATTQATGGASAMSFFVTSVGLGNGADLGGLDGADRHCQTLAAGVGAGGRMWRAYLSASASGAQPAVNARDRIGRGPWQNAKGEVVARDVEELHGANKLTKQTALTEKGEVVNGRGDTPNRHDILTGSQADGSAFAGSDDRTCGNWTKRGEGSAMLGHHDRIGLRDDDASRSWNASHPSRACGQDALRATGGDGLLYCFATN